MKSSGILSVITCVTLSFLFLSYFCSASSSSKSVCKVSHCYTWWWWITASGKSDWKLHSNLFTSQSVIWCQFRNIAQCSINYLSTSWFWLGFKSTAINKTTSDNMERFVRRYLFWDYFLFVSFRWLTRSTVYYIPTAHVQETPGKM